MVNNVLMCVVSLTRSASCGLPAHVPKLRDAKQHLPLGVHRHTTLYGIARCGVARRKPVLNGHTAQSLAVENAFIEGRRHAERAEQASAAQRSIARLTELKRRVLDEHMAGHPNKAMANHLLVSAHG